MEEIWNWGEVSMGALSLTEQAILDKMRSRRTTVSFGSD
jgi:hypothetical protein